MYFYLMSKATLTFVIYFFIAKVKSRMKKITCKYGLKVPRKVTHAYELNKGNINTLWSDEIKR